MCACICDNGFKFKALKPHILSPAGEVIDYTCHNGDIQIKIKEDVS